LFALVYGCTSGNKGYCVMFTCHCYSVCVTLVLVCQFTVFEPGFERNLSEVVPVKINSLSMSLMIDGERKLFASLVSGYQTQNSAQVISGLVWAV
jgi:hypothetical protein